MARQNFLWRLVEYAVRFSSRARLRGGSAMYDPLMDPEAVRSMRLGRTAAEADWPPRPRPTSGKPPATPADTRAQED